MALDLSVIDVETFLKELGMNNVRDEGREVKYSCFSDFHSRGDANPSASMEKGSTKFYCFSCGMGGNAVTFLATLENVSPLQSSIWIKERFGGGLNTPEPGSVKDTVEEILNKEEKHKKTHIVPILGEEEITRRRVDWKSLENDYYDFTSKMIHELPGETFEDIFKPVEKKDNELFYMFKRGFEADTLIEWQIGWDRISERFTIPVRNENSKLVGFKARAPERDPKYLVLGGAEYGFDPYETSRVIFGLDKVDWKKTHDLIICEGELNCIAMHQMGFKNTVGISGKILSDYQAKIINKYAAQVLLIFDEDEDARKAADKLQLFIPTRIVAPHDNDPASMSIEEIVSLLRSNRSSLLKYKNEQLKH